MKKRMMLLWLLLLLILCSCSFTKMESPNLINMEEVITQLTSAPYKGRLTGTEGNTLAVKYIEERFKEIGLEPLNNAEGSYLLEYPHQFYDPEKLEFKIILTLANGTIKELERGVDFLERSAFSNFKVKSYITLEPNDPNIAEKFIVLEDEQDIPGLFEQAQGIFIKEEFFFRSLSVDRLEKPIIQISNQTYELLKNNPNTKVEMICHAEKELIQAANVVGKIPSRDHTSAIILSAHLDHVGWVNKQIYGGAIDNASGIAILLDVAKKLHQYTTNGKILQADTIFVAFNGEESNFQGSKHFVDYIQSQYENLYNINIDSVFEEPLEIGSIDEGASEELLKDIQNFLHDKGISAEITITNQSDHISFSEQHINALTIGSKNIKGNIHHPSDHMDKVDFQFLDHLSDAVYQFILTYNGKRYEHVQPTIPSLTPTEEAEIMKRLERINREVDLLAFDEYKIIEVDEIRYLVQKYNDTFEGKQFDQLYPNINYPKKIGDFHLRDIYVSDITMLNVEMNQLDIEKIYKRERIKENIQKLIFTYSKTEGNIEYQFLLTINKDLEIRDEYKIEQSEIDGKMINLKYQDENKLGSFFYIQNEGKDTYKVQISKGEKASIMFEGKELTGIKSNLTATEIEEILSTYKIFDLVNEILKSL